MKKELVITGRAELGLLFTTPIKYRPVRMNIAGFSDGENAHWEQQVRSAYFACGCDTGAYFVLAAILFSLVYLLLQFSSVASAPFLHISRMGLVLLASGFAGKMLGIAKAKRNLKQVVESLHKELQ